MSELAEIATLCALEKGVTLLAIVGSSPNVTQFGNLPVVSSFEGIPGGCDGAVLTDLTTPAETFRRTVSELGVDRVLVPPILGIGAISSGATVL